MYRVSFGCAEKILELESQCSYNIVNELDATESYAVMCLKW